MKEEIMKIEDFINVLVDKYINIDLPIPEEIREGIFYYSWIAIIKDGEDVKLKFGSSISLEKAYKNLSRKENIIDFKAYYRNELFDNCKMITAYTILYYKIYSDMNISNKKIEILYI